MSDYYPLPQNLNDEQHLRAACLKLATASHVGDHHDDIIFAAASYATYIMTGYIPPEAEKDEG